MRLSQFSKPQLGIKTGSCGSSGFKFPGDPGGVVTTKLFCSDPELLIVSCRRPTRTISVLSRGHLYSTLLWALGVCPAGFLPGGAIARGVCVLGVYLRRGFCPGFAVSDREKSREKRPLTGNCTGPTCDLYKSLLTPRESNHHRDVLCTELVAMVHGERALGSNCATAV